MFKYIILGIIQGLTEFFPVSSSGHLVIIQSKFGISGQELVLPVVLHLGTILALIIFFSKEIKKIFSDLKSLSFITIVTLITGIIGLSGKKFFESLFSQPKLVAFALIITGITLIFTKKFSWSERKNVSLKDALFLGLAQGLTIIPGISRSGITISTLLFRGIERETAFHLSFIASIPAVMGAALLEAKDIFLNLNTDFVNLLVGFSFSFLAGLISLWGLKWFLRKAKLYYFGYYCVIVAIITLLFIR